MSDVLGFEDLDSISLIAMSGRRVKTGAAGRAIGRLSFTSAPVVDDAHGLTVSASVSLLLAGEDGSEPELMYEGAVTYYARLHDDGPDERDVNGRDVIPLMWPYLRVGLQEHASRLGVPVLGLAVSLSPALLAEHESPDEELEGADA